VASIDGDNTIRIRDVQSSKDVQTITGHENTISALAFTRDGKGILSSGEDNQVRVWDVATGKLLKVFQGHADKILDVVPRPDGWRLASSSMDSTIKLWILFSRGQPDTREDSKHWSETVMGSPDGGRLGLKAKNGYYYVPMAAEGKNFKSLSFQKGHTTTLGSAAFDQQQRVLLRVPGNRLV
jgi:WD40 repeat protein